MEWEAVPTARSDIQGADMEFEQITSWDVG